MYSSMYILANIYYNNDIFYICDYMLYIINVLKKSLSFQENLKIELGITLIFIYLCLRYVADLGFWY